MTTHIAVAMSCEARPLLDAFGLRRDPAATAYPVFAGEGIALVVTGVGTVASAGGVGYLAGRTGATRADPWVNVGIAGHATLPIGTVALGHEVRDAATGRRRYPPRSLVESMDSTAVISVAEVEREYAEDAAYEMEAAGFVDTARRFGAAEIVQVLKVASDGPGELWNELDEARIVELMAQTIEPLRSLVACLAGAPVGAPLSGDLLESRLSSWRFSVTQRRQLASLQRRWQALVAEEDFVASLEDALSTIAASASRTEILARLEAFVSALPIVLGASTDGPV